MTINYSVAELTSVNGQGSGDFIAGNEILTVGHVAVAVGTSETITISGVQYSGIVTHIQPGAPTGSSETNSQVTNDFAVISLSSSVEPSLTMAAVTVPDAGIAGTVVGYPGVLIGGVPTSLGIQQQASVTIYPVTNLTDTLVTTNPMIQGASGGAVLDSSGHLIGIISGNNGTYNLDVALSATKIATINGWMSQDAFVTGLYHAGLNRGPDLAGFGYYEGEDTASAAFQVINSPEFQNAHGTNSFVQDVQLFYQQGLGRVASSAEMSWWQSHTSDPVAVLVGVATSAEAQQHWGTVGVA